jgi:hypothetical protein
VDILLASQAAANSKTTEEIVFRLAGAPGFGAPLHLQGFYSSCRGISGWAPTPSTDVAAR